MKAIAQSDTGYGISHRTRQIVAWVAVLGCLASPLASAELENAETTESDEAARTWCALLIGIENYAVASSLPYVSNDVRELGLVLRERGGYTVTEVVDTARAFDGQAEGEQISEREALMQEIAAWLAKLGPTNNALVYFSGHGFRDADGKLYLAAVDCDPDNPVPGGVPVQWLRNQIADCKADVKLLIMDACHAGAQKALQQSTSVVAKELADPFRGLERVMTLASCQGEEKSWIWPEKRQSVFSYWLKQGLKGHADKDGNGEVDIDELYNHAQANVPHVVEKLYGMPQHSVRMIGPKIVGVPVVIRPSPNTLKGLLDEMAEQLATFMQLKEVTAVGVPEFGVVDSKKQELQLGADFGTLGSYCATELEGYLIDKSADRFEVYPSDALHQALKALKLGPKDLRSAKVKELAVGQKKVPALAEGVLRSREERVVNLQCTLVSTERNQLFGRAGGAALLNESEWGKLGYSVTPPDPEPPTPQNPVPPHLVDPVPLMDAESEKPHPLSNEDFPFPVKVMVDRKERKGVFKGNNMYVPLGKGEVYRIRVENHDGRLTLLRLLVDGRNTLAEKVPVKGVYPEGTGPRPEYQIAQPVNLSEARHWALDPDVANLFEVRGFYSKADADGNSTCGEFTVAAAPDTESERSVYGGDLGMITAAFYAPPSDGTSRGGVMTKPGRERKQKLRLYKATGVGTMLHVVHIRYVEPETFEQIRKSL